MAIQQATGDFIKPAGLRQPVQRAKKFHSCGSAAKGKGKGSAAKNPTA
jgi:hypothetical protein